MLSPRGHNSLKNIKLDRTPLTICTPTPVFVRSVIKIPNGLGGVEKTKVLFKENVNSRANIFLKRTELPLQYAHLQNVTSFKIPKTV
jgi:hypothetical protein